jgi:leader peptidase (prepilin peptidase)/N-methyltransferase
VTADVLNFEVVGLLATAPVIGSFLGLVVCRLTQGLPIVWSRSRCQYCAAVLGPRDLVPLLSWFVSLGRCRHCGRRIDWFYPAIEMAALLVAVIAIGVNGVPRAWLDCLLGWWLLALAWIDARKWVLPDPLTLPLIAAGLVASSVLEPDSLLDRALGAAGGYLAMRGLAAVYRVARRREGMGGGDAKLLSAAGAWLGLSALPQVILISAIIGLLAVAALRLLGTRLSAETALPFGPPLAVAIWAISLFGQI